MTSRVSLSADAIEPSVRERAEAAARRAGMSLNDYLNSAIGRPVHDEREAQDVAEIHRRLDAIARQMDQMAPPRMPRSEPPAASQLNDAISRLDARLSQLSAPRPAAAPPPPRAAASAMPAGQSPIDFSIAEIIARQGELDGFAARTSGTASRMPPPSFVNEPAPPQFDTSGIERQLSVLTSQMQTSMHRSDGIEQSIASFRAELADIRQSITEALPRRAIESLENDIRALTRRIDETRSNGIDAEALLGVERALSDIRAELHTLKPAEQLAGFDQAIRNLGGQLDTIVRSSGHPATLQQLEDAIAALKSIVSHVASNDALSELAAHVRTLSGKVDQLANASGGSDFLTALEQRIAQLTTALEQRERAPAADSAYFDDAVRTITERLDRLQVGGDTSASLSHVEQRVHHLLERLEATEARTGDIARLEQGLADVLRHLETQRAATVQPASSPAMDPALVEAIKRELADIRFSQSETTRSTQDSLEAVHNTLGHVVDRLSQIEDDLRSARSAPAAREPAREDRRAAPAMPASTPLRDIAEMAEQAIANQVMANQIMANQITANQVTANKAPSNTPRAAMLPIPRPELPNPAAAQAPISLSAPNTPPLVPSQGAERLAPPPVPAAAAPRPAAPARTPIDPSLPPDHPLEPGSRRGGGSPSERIAASESVLNEIAGSPRDSGSTANFIQAARRAAQAAAAAAPPPAASGAKANRVTALNDAARASAKPATDNNSGLSSKIRFFLVAASVVVIVLGTVRMGINLLSGDDNSNSGLPAESRTTSPPPAPTPAPAPAENAPRSDLAPAMPSITSPTPFTRQSTMPQQPVAPVEPAPMAAPRSPDVTGSIVTPQERAAAIPAPKTGKAKSAALVPMPDPLPEAIGALALRNAANAGDPGAAYEIGVRYAEGRGVAPDYAAAAKWYEHAAKAGVVPAAFRLGTLYEKGLGLKKDMETARTYYVQAAEKGNAKAMHNLAVLDADGGGAGPNYKSASQWFRKAAEHGVADSQFNLGILYARGIGVEQNLAESYKWFSLAAAQGDTDSSRKRDDVAKRLDPQSLAAARLAVQTFTPDQQPEEATSVGAPATGWDAAPPAKSVARPVKTNGKSAAKSAPVQSAAR